MSNLLIAVDLAEDVFELAVARPSGEVVERKRLTRAQFERFWETREPCSVVMEACSSCHHWARHLLSLGFEASLLPPRYVRPYRQRGKTDRIDCDALLEAARSPPHQGRRGQEPRPAGDPRAAPCAGAVEEHANDAHQRHARHAARVWHHGAPRSHQIPGAAAAAARAPSRDAARAGAPARPRLLERGQRTRWADARDRTRAGDPRQAGTRHPGTARDPRHRGAHRHCSLRLRGQRARLPSGRHLASWLGVTPRENSSGNRRRPGRITKQGDPYLRTLPIHGARSAPNVAQQRQRAGKRVSRLQGWALKEAAELHHSNQAAVALACSPVHAQRAAPQARAHRLGDLEA